MCVFSPASLLFVFLKKKLSIAAPHKSSTEEAIYNTIYDKGALLIAAAGNAGTSDRAYPASHDSVVSVAAVDGRLRRAYFSQYNDGVELAAERRTCTSF